MKKQKKSSTRKKNFSTWSSSRPVQQLTSILGATALFLVFTGAPWPGQLFAQESSRDTSVWLAQEGRKILEHPEFAVRDSVNRWFARTMEDYLSTEKGFRDPLDSVTNMMGLGDEDGRFRIFTWQRPDRDYIYKRYGLVVVQTDDGLVTTLLEDKMDELPELDFTVFGPEEWPGALYYKLLPDGQKDNKYTLLGYASGEPLNRKVIEVLEIRENGKPRFGGKIFHIQEFMDKTFRRPPMRLVLRYGSEYSATVNWREKNEKVVMDHLSPPEKKMKGMYRFYGPDFTYDALYWKKDWWYLEEDVRIDGDQNIIIAPPAPRPSGNESDTNQLPGFGESP